MQNAVLHRWTPPDPSSPCGAIRTTRRTVRALRDPVETCEIVLEIQFRFPVENFEKRDGQRESGERERERRERHEEKIVRKK